MVKCKAFNALVAVFFPDISQFYIDSLLFETYPPKHSCPLPSTWWVVGFQAATQLAEEGWLLGQHHLFIMIRPLPRPNNLLTFTKTYMSSGSLTSSGAAHGPISLSGLSSLQYIYIKLYNLVIMNYRVCYMCVLLLCYNKFLL